MRTSISQNWSESEPLLPLLVLAFIVFFTYGFLVEAPYAGFYFNPSNGQVIEIYVNSSPTTSLQLGDLIEQVGSVSWDSYHVKGTQPLFEDAQPGQTVEIVIQRNGKRLTIPWVYPGFNQQELLSRLFNFWWLSYAFWAFGMLTQLFMRPKDARWRLLIAANYLTALWLIAGSLSSWEIWGSSLLLHALTWLILPVYLNLHWIFPKPLGRITKLGWSTLYAVCGFFALCELLRLLPRSLYLLSFFLALLGSLALMGVHFLKQPAQRRAIGFLTITILVALAPSILLSILGMSGNIPQISTITLLALPIMPGAYFYIVYRQQLAGLELRANRVFSLYAFLILLGTVLLLLVIPLAQLATSPGMIALLTIGVTGLAALASILVFPSFQAWVERRLLGIELPYKNLPETYSARITTSTSLGGLQRLLEQEILSSLLVRQFAFLRAEQGSLQTLLAVRLTPDQIPGVGQVSRLRAMAGKYLPPNLSEDQAYPWMRLVLPLQLEGELIGFWLFGRRDPDDIYSQAEIPVLQSLADQTAIALSNILQTERLKALYQADINRYEQERLRLARDLHDSVLNQMAAMLMKLDPSSLPSGFQHAYDGLTQRLREIVSELRPPMLSYGLKPALEELADNLMERSQDAIGVTAELQADQSRYDASLEQHLYRIVQQACENALRHAQANHIYISGQLAPQKIDLRVEDDGVGFKLGEKLELGDLLAKKHFGLAGMIERAELIGAEIKIRSAPGRGTKVHIAWRPNLG